MFYCWPEILGYRANELCDIFNNYFVNVAKNIGNVDELIPVLLKLKITTLIWH
jgi:hypothetical protein